jgi:hypothetical protein
MAFIELWGPPGSGKTSLAHKMLADDAGLRPGRRSLKCESDMQLGRFFPAGTSLWVVFSKIPIEIKSSFFFYLDSRSIPLSLRLFSLMVQARVLSQDDNLWIIDQGIHQHILTALANNKLSIKRAHYWRSKLGVKPYSPIKLISVSVPLDQLIYQLENSDKHLKQAGDLGVILYAKKMVAAFRELNLC